MIHIYCTVTRKFNNDSIQIPLQSSGFLVVFLESHPKSHYHPHQRRLQLKFVWSLKCGRSGIVSSRGRIRDSDGKTQFGDVGTILEYIHFRIQSKIEVPSHLWGLEMGWSNLSGTNPPNVGLVLHVNSQMRNNHLEAAVELPES